MIIKNTIFGLTVAAILAGGCSFLDPLPDGSYNDENFGDYPELLRGFVDKAYADYFPAVYYSTYCAGLAAATDDALYRSETAMWRSFSKGNARMGNNPFASKWNNDYTAINYLNLFLKDNVGYNTRYLEAPSVSEPGFILTCSARSQARALTGICGVSLSC